MEGLAVWLSHGQSIVPPAGQTSWEHLANPVLGLPAPVYVFIVVTVILAVVMRRTRFGRQIYLLGENRTAARAAALPITLLTVGAFGIASLYTAGSGVLIGATSANASLLLVGSYTYDAIAAALVGGNAVTGGRGSIARTALGAIFIATISDMHAKVVVADDVSFVGSFNFSRSGERNAENVLEIHDPATADTLARYVEEVAARYPRATLPETQPDVAAGQEESLSAPNPRP